nr:integrase, catalytic region, zinc finger, CCHC-type, peptidase aspartic, catalytic [Tanacetum cinerariifolium]
MLAMVHMEMLQEWSETMQLDREREAHKDYLKYTQEQAAFLRELFKQGRSLNPLDSALDYAYLEVAFRKHICFIRDLEGVDLLKGLMGSNLYTFSLENMMSSSPMSLVQGVQDKILVMASKMITLELRLRYYSSQTRSGLRTSKTKVSEGSFMLCMCSKKNQETFP